MLASALSASIVGVDGVPVRVEVDVAFGLPGLTIVGLAGSAVLEARERVRAALRNSGFEVPARRITINLAPADLPKEGTGHDLAMATAILVASDQLEPAGDAGISRIALIGELALDGSLRAVPGVMALVSAARACGAAAAIVPAEAAAEAAAVGGIRVHGAHRLGAGGPSSCGLEPLEVARTAASHRRADTGRRAGHRVRGRASRWPANPRDRRCRAPQPGVQRAAGRRQDSPRPSGRRDSCRRSTRTRPPRSAESDPWRGRPIVDRSCPAVARFGRPHHTISLQALVGGGPRVRPGEVSLAHRGALFLDETLQFRADALDALRGPLDSGSVTIARVERVLSLPARFMLIAAFNPCPCGWFGTRGRTCTCEDGVRRRYHARLSGPIRDRLDLVVPLVPVASLGSGSVIEGSRTVAARMAAAATRQRARQGIANAELPPDRLDDDAGFDRRLRIGLDCARTCTRAVHAACPSRRTRGANDRRSRGMRCGPRRAHRRSTGPSAAGRPRVIGVGNHPRRPTRRR